MAKRRQDNDETPDENQGPADDSADNFGLPDIEYKPLEHQEEAIPAEAHSEPESLVTHEPEAAAKDGPDEPYGEEEETSSKAPLILSIVIGLVVLTAGYLLYKYVYKPKLEKQKQEELAKKADERNKVIADSLKSVKEAEDRKRMEAEAAAKAKPVEGSIETLSNRTQRYYVVVTSDIDGDLVMDYAKKLSAKGVSSKIIPPFNKSKYSRLSIADFDSYSAAQSSADASKAEYGNGLWVIKY